MRLSVTAKMNPTLPTILKARTARQKANLTVTSEKSANRVVTRVVADCPRDTNYMADHTEVRFTDEGLGYKVGWWRSAFVGQTNPATGKVITTFYPFFVVHGTRFMAGRDVLTPNLRAERPNFRKAAQRALSG